MSTSMVAGPVLLESMVKFVGTPGWTFPFSRPGPKAFTLEASAGPSPFPPEKKENQWNFYKSNIIRHYTKIHIKFFFNAVHDFPSYCRFWVSNILLCMPSESLCNISQEHITVYTAPLYSTIIKKIKIFVLNSEQCTTSDATKIMLMYTDLVILGQTFPFNLPKSCR